jgi:hypothetical protein
MPLVAALLIVVVLFGGAGAVAYASQGSLPGDLLYPGKLATERGRLLVKLGPARKAEYHLELAQKRLKEVLSLANEGRLISPAAVEAIASQMDAAIEEVRKIPSEDAQAILGEFSAEIMKQQPALADAKRQAAPEANLPLTQADLLLKRGHAIARALSENPMRLETKISIKAARQGRLTGTVSSLNPLRIAGLEIVLSPDAKAEGVLRIGSMAEVEGTFLGEGTLLASQIKVVEKEDTTRIELKGVITGLAPLTVADWIVVLLPEAEVEGVPRVGLIASVEGRLQDDGSVLASELEVERLEKETELRGPVTLLEPLTVRSTVIVLGPDTEIEGVLRAGAMVEVKGRFLRDERLLASKIDASADEKAKTRKQERVKGIVVGIAGAEITVETETGQRFTVLVTGGTRVRLDDSRGDVRQLRVGDELEVRYNPASGVALEIRLED